MDPSWIHDTAMSARWIYDGSMMDPCYHDRSTMDPWGIHGTTMGPRWSYTGSMVDPWYHDGSTINPSWVHGTAMGPRKIHNGSIVLGLINIKRTKFEVLLVLLWADELLEAGHTTCLLWYSISCLSCRCGQCIHWLEGIVYVWWVSS